MAAHVGPDFTQAHHQHPGVGHVGRQLFYQLQRGVGCRSGPVAERGFLLHALVGEEYGVQQPVQKRPGRVGIGRPLVGLLYLVADLQVANHLGLQAHGHLKQVAHGIGMTVEHIEVREVRADISGRLLSFPRASMMAGLWSRSAE